MSDLILFHPIRTLDNKLLFPAGTKLSSDMINDLLLESGNVSYEQYCLLQHGTVRNDILGFITMRPYNAIFSSNEVIDDLMNFMEKVHITAPVIESLDYFKENDAYTYRHILNVFALCVYISKVMMSDNWARLNETASGPMHDIGKICVPLHILRKTSPLTMRERSILEHHTIAGYVLLSYYFQNTEDPFAFVARDHHERREGSGYPRGIKLNNHIVDIIAVCDVFDALISTRPYRSSAYNHRTAIEVIAEMGDNNILNPDVIKTLVSISRKKKSHFSECEISHEKRGNPPLFNNYGKFEDDNN